MLCVSQSELIGSATLLKEANIISVEMKKDIIFQFALMAKGPFSMRFPSSSQLYVDVTNQHTRESVAMWPLNVLRCISHAMALFDLSPMMI